MRFALIAILTGLSLWVLGCSASAPTRSVESSRAARPGNAPLTAAPGVTGDPVEGRRLFSRTGCAGCHTVNGTLTSTGVAGPNLSHVVLRPTLAGDAIPMTPQTLARFLRDPSAVKPGTAMPNVGLTVQEAEHLVAYLYSQPYNPLP
ncbi:MAG: cytochrome c family protein [Chloroflexota bacterium]